MKRLRVLALYWHPQREDHMRAAIRGHLHALDSSPQHRIFYHNAFHPPWPWLRHRRFDAVILHTTFLCMRWSHLFYIWKWRWRWLRDLDCVKIAMPQDEYDHSEILDEWLYEWGVRAIFTNFGSACRPLLYPLMHSRATFYPAYTGYVDEVAARTMAAKLRPLAERPYDLVYRASNLPYWFGSHGQLKHRIAGVVGDRAHELGLSSDISTRQEDTVVGDQWLDFLATGRAVIACESGSSVLDRRGEIKAKILALLRVNRELTFEEVAARMPAGWDDYRFFAISPRHFEAVITKTCQVLVEGHYDGVFEAGRHYIPLKRDFSNLDEVLAKVRDVRLVNEMVERAYAEIYLTGRYSYRKLAADLTSAMGLSMRCDRPGGGSVSPTITFASEGERHA